MARGERDADYPLSNQALALRLLDSGEAITEVVLCLTKQHHAKGDIAMCSRSSMQRGCIFMNGVGVLKDKVDQFVKHTLVL